MNSEDLHAALGEALREARTEARKSQESLQITTGVHRNYIGGIERGQRCPTIDTINVLANALDIGLDELFVSAVKKHNA